MKTAMQDLIDDIQQAFQGQWGVYLNSEKFEPYLEKEKEQIIAAVRYGQNNHIENVYEEGKLYYNEIYNSDAQFIKSSIPNGNIEITKTNNI